MTEAPPRGPECVVCGNGINGPVVGMGDGTGRKFAHRECYPSSTVQFSRVMDPSKFEADMPGINLGHPAIARFAARWLNAALDFWRNW